MKKLLAACAICIISSCSNVVRDRCEKFSTNIIFNGIVFMELNINEADMTYAPLGGSDMNLKKIDSSRTRTAIGSVVMDSVLRNSNLISGLNNNRICTIKAYVYCDENDTLKIRYIVSLKGSFHCRDEYYKCSEYIRSNSDGNESDITGNIFIEKNAISYI